MNKLILLPVLILLASCGKDRMTRCYVCTNEQNKKASEFVASNIKNSNNMSDEEMEDVIRQLEKTAIKLNCEQRFLKSDFQGGIYWEEVPKEKGVTYHPYIY